MIISYVYYYTITVLIQYTNEQKKKKIIITVFSCEIKTKSISI